MLLSLWVAGFAVGIALSLALSAQAAIAVAATAMLVAIWQFGRKRPALAGAALALALGVARALPALPDAEAPGLAEATPLPVWARLAAGPDPRGAPGEGSRLLLEIEKISQRPAAGTAALVLRGETGGLAPGDELSFRGTVRAPWGLANFGLPDARRQAAARGIDNYAALAPGTSIVVERAGSAAAPRRLAFHARRAMAEAITNAVPEPRAALLRALVLGERAAIPAAVEEGFRAAGATHVLSVSGLHLGVVAALVFWLLRAAAAVSPALALRATPARVAAILSLPVVWFYTLVTGEAIATLRSALMAAVALGAIVLGRPFSLAPSIALAALVLLLRSPLAIADVSFQLSFTSVLALALFVRNLAPQRRQAAERILRVAAWLGRFGAATCAAALVTAPLVAHHFGQITPVAPLGNLALVPLVELFVLPVGLGGAAVACLYEPLGGALLGLAGWAAGLAIAVADLFRRFAPVILVRLPNVFETAALMGSAGLLLWGLGRDLGGPGRRRGWLIAAAAGVALAAGSLAAREIHRRTSDEVRVTFLDVGQGDAAVVEGPRGFVAVIDGGGTPNGSFDVGARVVEPFLRARGIGRIDLVVLSHPHPDHMEGLFAVLSRFEVGALWAVGDEQSDRGYKALRDLARHRGVAVPEPAPLAWRGLSLVPLGPWLGDRIAHPPGTSVNDASLVVRASYAGRSVLFAGDLEADGEAELVGRGALGLAVASDVLKVPHHGSRTSSSPELLDASRPRLAVISLGRHNRFRFPRPEVLSRYAERGIQVLRTDQAGAITVTIGPAGELSTTCARSCP